MARSLRGTLLSLRDEIRCLVSFVLGVVLCRAPTQVDRPVSLATISIAALVPVRPTVEYKRLIRWNVARDPPTVLVSCTVPDSLYNSVSVLLGAHLDPAVFVV